MSPPAHERKEISFTGTTKVCGITPTPQEVRYFSREPFKGSNEIRLKDIEKIGPAEMEDVEDDLHSKFVGSIVQFVKRRKIVNAWGGFDYMPPRALPHRADPEIEHEPVILARELIVPGGREYIQTLPCPRFVSGTFESGLKKT